MTDRLVVYSLLKGYNASSYYRLEVPLTTAEDMGLGVYPILDSFDPEVPNEQRMAALYQSDLLLFYQPVGQSLIDHGNQIQRMIPAKQGGNWKWPPSIVIDTDDNLFDVNPLNNAFQGLGIRMPNGEPIEAGDEVGIMDTNGKRHRLWKDGEDGFSVAENRKKLDIYRQILNLSDAVTCSTPETEAYVKRESEAKRTFVTPNCIRLDHYEPVELAPHPGKIRIMWQGSPTHEEDWFPLRNAMGYLTRRYPEIEWVIWGVLYPWVMELVPTDRYRHIKWTPYTQYKLRLCTIGHDINLAPLTPTRFNLCRSAIKFYESSILRQPAATVAQATGPYLAEIQDGETGLLYRTPEEFIEKVSFLVENEQERRRIASNAKDWVNENRDAFKVVPKLVDYWRELRELKKQERPQPSEEEWAKIAAEMEEWKAEETAKAKAEQRRTKRQAKRAATQLNGKAEDVAIPAGHHHTH